MNTKQAEKLTDTLMDLMEEIADGRIAYENREDGYYRSTSRRTELADKLTELLTGVKTP